MSKRTSGVALVAALSVVFPLAACGSPSTSAPAADAAGVVKGDLDAVCAAGADEGSLVFWGSEESETQKKLAADFADAYPGIAVDFLSLRPEDIAQRLILESASSRALEVDVIEGNLDAFEPLVGRDLIDQDVDWAALGVRESIVTDSNMVREYRIANGIVYNPQVTPEDSLPDTWEDLIDPRWAGTVVVDPRGNPLQSLALELGVDGAVDYVQRLKDVVQPVVIEGGTAGMLTVASGENELTTNGRAAETLEQQAAGSPLEIHFLDIIPTSDFYHAMVAGAQHPNAAACWTGWMVSEEGSAKILEYAYKSNDDIPPGAPEGAVIAAIETGDQLADAVAAASRISEIWAGVAGTK